MEESIKYDIDLSYYNDIQERFDVLSQKVKKCNKILENNLQGGSKQKLTSKEKDKKIDKLKKKVKNMLNY